MRKLFHKNDPEIERLKLRQRLSYGPSVVGIDIGASSVNIAQMANHRGKRMLIKTRVVDIVAKPNESHDEATLRVLHVALEDFSRRNAKYVCVVNCPQTCVRKVTTPYMPQEDLGGAVSLETKRLIPFPLSEAILDYNVIEEVVEKGVQKLSIIVAASPKKTIDRILSFFVLKKAKPFSGTISKKFASERKPDPLDLKISALLPLSLCLENIIERSKLKTNETLVTIEIGTIVTGLNIYKNSRLQFSRKIPFSGNDITQSLTGALMTDKGKVELTLQEAERIKREYGIPGIEEDKDIDGKITTRQMLSLIRPKIEQLANEIERSFDFFREEMHGSKIDRVVLFGGGAQLKGLPGFLSKELGLEIGVGNPLADIDLIAPDVVEREEDAHKLVLAIGAALSSLGGINLLPIEMKEKAVRVVKKAVINAGIAVAVATFLMAAVLLLLQTKGLEKKLRTAKQELEQLSPKLAKAKERVTISQLLSAQPFWDEALKEISNVIPSNMYLHSIQMENGLVRMEGIVEKGTGTSETTLSQFMVALEKGLFRNVKLIKTERKTQSLANIEFEISGRIE